MALELQLKMTPCPTCWEDTSTLCGCRGTLHCPACATVPERTPHAYNRLLTDEEVGAIWRARHAGLVPSALEIRP